jgi:putative Holliday junction resolvase
MPGTHKPQPSLTGRHDATHFPHSSSLQGYVLAFDYGLKRIGVAVGEASFKLAHPLATINDKNESTRLALIAELIHAWKPALFVVGLPTHMDGSEHFLTQQARRFARRLEARFHIKAVLVDERLSSDYASHRLHEAHVRGSKQKSVLDQVAAQEILQTFFDER